MGSAILALVAVLTLSWVYGEKARGSLKNSLKQCNSVVEQLKGDVLASRKKSRELSEKLDETERELEAESNSRKDTEKKLEFAILDYEKTLKQCISRAEIEEMRNSLRKDVRADYERELNILKARTKDLVVEKTRLEFKLNRLSKKQAELSALTGAQQAELLRAKAKALSRQDTLKFENDLLKDKLDGMRRMLLDARSKGSISAGMAEKVEAGLAEVEATLKKTKVEEGPGKKP